MKSDGVDDECWDERLLGELATVFHDRARATRLVVGVGFPRSIMPEFVNPLTFWTKVMEEACNGALPGGIRAIVAAARVMYPDNRVFGQGRIVPRADAHDVLGQRRVTSVHMPWMVLMVLGGAAGWWGFAAHQPPLVEDSTPAPTVGGDEEPPIEWRVWLPTIPLSPAVPPVTGEVQERKPRSSMTPDDRRGPRTWTVNAVEQPAGTVSRIVVLNETVAPASGVLELVGRAGPRKPRCYVERPQVIPLRCALLGSRGMEISTSDRFQAVD